MSTVSNHHFLLREEQSGIFLQKDALWDACAYSRRSPFKESFNEDAVGIIRVDDETAVFAIADGCGGMRGGEQASSIALQVLADSIERNESGPDRLRVAILDGIEQANIAAMHHEDRHLISNVVGDARMRIEIGPALTLSQRDTVVIASDGLFDNLSIAEVVDGLRKGKLAQSVDSVTELAYQRMLGIKDQPCKPDDLSIVAIRPCAG